MERIKYPPGWFFPGIRNPLAHLRITMGYGSLRALPSMTDMLCSNHEQ
jgi:hypothetical protein